MPLEIKHHKIHEPGIFFGVPEEQYHACLALSAHGIIRMRVSPYVWWAESPLNPNKEPDEETDAKRIGRAYNRRIVEGLETFLRHYAAKLDPADYPKALRTNAELSAALAEYGVRGLSTLRKAELIHLLRNQNPNVEIWDDIVERHARINEGKILLDGDLMQSIENAAAAIETHPQLCKAFTGGMPEVSIFWFDQTTGVPCKARLDYLKMLAIVDLKTFELRDANVNRTIARAVAAYKYHIQASWYLRAADQIKGLIEAGQVGGVVERTYLEQIRDAVARTFLFVWQAKGVAPIVRGKVLGAGIALDLGHLASEEALTQWAQCWERWHTEPWAEIHDIEQFDDAEFPPPWARSSELSNVVCLQKPFRPVELIGAIEAALPS